MAYTVRVYASSTISVLQSNSSSYSSARSGENLTVSTTYELQPVIGQVFNTPNYTVREHLFHFEFSADVVLGATFSYYCVQGKASADDAVEIRSKTWTFSDGTAAWVAGDDIGSLTLLGSDLFPNTSEDPVRRNVTLSNFTTTNLQNIGLYSNYHRVGTAPTGQEEIMFIHSSVQTTTEMYLDVSVGGDLVFIIAADGSGSLTVPIGVTSAAVEVWGAGGGYLSAGTQEGGGGR